MAPQSSAQNEPPLQKMIVWSSSHHATPSSDASHVTVSYETPRSLAMLLSAAAVPPVFWPAPLASAPFALLPLLGLFELVLHAASATKAVNRIERVVMSVSLCARETAADL